MKKSIERCCAMVSFVFLLSTTKIKNVTIRNHSSESYSWKTVKKLYCRKRLCNGRQNFRFWRQQLQKRLSFFLRAITKNSKFKEAASVTADSKQRAQLSKEISLFEADTVPLRSSLLQMILLKRTTVQLMYGQACLTGVQQNSKQVAAKSKLFVIGSNFQTSLSQLNRRLSLQVAPMTELLVAAMIGKQNCRVWKHYDC